MTLSQKDIAALDHQDPLRSFQSQFNIPDGVIYLDGNSLGPPPRAALDRLQKTATDEWRTGLVSSWNDAHWIDLPRSCGAKIARLIGADEQDVIVCDSVSVNIFKLAAALSATKPGAIAYEKGEFPTDGYILQGLAKLTGTKLIEVLPCDTASIPEGVSVLIKSLVHYKSAEIADIGALESAAAQSGAAIIWDLSHATGLLDLDLPKAGAHYAVGCGYKYLNGGPGAPAFVFVSAEKSNALDQPLSGWMGHAAPFAFAGQYQPADGVARFASGTPPILSLSALDAALDIYDGVDLSLVETKTRKLGDIFIEQCLSLGLEIASPGVGEQRGGHVCVRHPHSYEIMRALIARGVIGDFRTPDLMRFGFSPLFLTYADIWHAADILKNILDTEEWRQPEFSERKTVT